jgi:hypothetical protein
MEAAPEYDCGKTRREVDSSLAAAGNYAPPFAQLAAALIDFLCENTDDQIICEKRINAEPNLGASH